MIWRWPTPSVAPPPDRRGPAENVLFNRSVRDNIALAQEALPMERVIEAAELAGRTSSSPPAPKAITP